jgi:hypothetical protein
MRRLPGVTAIFGIDRRTGLGCFSLQEVGAPIAFAPHEGGSVMMTLARNVLLFFGLLALAACAPAANVNPQDESNTDIRFTLPGPNPQAEQAARNERVAGFGTGLWHGLISAVTLVISFFNSEIQMYEVHNNGPMYNLGFLGGAVAAAAVLGLWGGRL